MPTLPFATLMLSNPSAADPSVAEAACGAIGALCLRHPENSHRFLVLRASFLAPYPSVADSLRHPGHLQRSKSEHLCLKTTAAAAAAAAAADAE
jgi:hypothetical protein